MYSEQKLFNIDGNKLILIDFPSLLFVSTGDDSGLVGESCEDFRFRTGCTCR